MSIPEKQPVRVMLRFAAVAFALAILSLASVALASGRVQWTNTHPKERDGESWHLEVKIFLARAPAVPHIPVKFEFKPTAYYERDMVDGDKIVERKVPLTNNQDIIEDVDIGFLDPSDGKIQARTKFSFKITRAHGFEAGEYKVTIRDARNGSLIGTPTHLVLDGENKAIDRRTMVFSGNDKPKKKKTEMKQVDRNGDVKDDTGSGGDKGDKGDDSAASDGDSSGDKPAADKPATDDTGAGSDDSSGDNGAHGGPPPIKEKPGCNCRMERTSTPADPAAWLAPLGLLFAFGLRRKRR